MVAGNKGTVRKGTGRIGTEKTALQEKKALRKDGTWKKRHVDEI